MLACIERFVVIQSKIRRGSRKARVLEIDVQGLGKRERIKAIVRMTQVEKGCGESSLEIRVSSRNAVSSGYSCFPTLVRTANTTHSYISNL